MKKQTVLVIHNMYGTISGEDVVFQNECEMLRKRGHKVITYTLTTKNVKSKAAMVKRAFTTFWSLKSYRTVKKLIRENDVDIVHCHNLYPLISPSVYYAARAMKVPSIEVIHNFRPLCANALFFRNGATCEECVHGGLFCAVRHRCYCNSRFESLLTVTVMAFQRLFRMYAVPYYICLTEFNKEKLTLLPQIKPERVFVKGNYVAQRCTSPVPGNNRRDCFVFGGRLEENKGIRVLLAAWEAMGESAPHLIICGNGPLLPLCREYVDGGRVKNAELMGQVAHDDFMDLVARARALVVPSQWYEGFPMTITEACAVGTPVVTGDIGNSAALVSEGVNGVHFHYDSAEDLARVILETDFSGMCDSTFALYNDLWTEDKNYETLLSIYERL